MSDALITALVAGGSAALLAVVASGLLAWEAAHRDLSQRVRHAVHLGAAGEIQPARTLSSILLHQLGKVGEAMRASAIFSPANIAELERTALSAGLDPRRVVSAMLGGKFMLILGLPTLAYAVVTLSGSSTTALMVSLALAVAIGMFGPNWMLNWARRSYANALRRGLPDALDLLVVCTEAGLGLESAIDRVATDMRPSEPAVALEFLTLGQEMRIASDRHTAIARLGERTGLEGFQRLSGTLSQTMRYGTPLGQALRILAAELRNERMMRLEERAAKLPALLTLPLILFILPCLFIVLVGPAAINTLNILS